MREKRVRKSIKISILTGLMALMMAVTAFGAAQMPDLDRKGSITVTMKTGSDPDSPVIPGGEMALYKVAEVYTVNDSVSGGWFFRLTDAFSGSGIELEGKTDDDLNGKWSEYSEILADYTDKNGIEPDEVKTVGTDGKAEFTDLTAGLYLLVQTVSADGWDPVNPFLVSIPYYEDGAYSYDIDTFPKTGPAYEEHFFQIDEEIVTDVDDIWDREAWIGDEEVNMNELIEIEMTTHLPEMSAYRLSHSQITMDFHNTLDSELILDEDTADFSVYIAGNLIDPKYYEITFDEATGDECNFHVDVDLTRLFNDGYVTEDMLDGNTEITIFFYVDLEDSNSSNHYESIVWYDVYDGYEKEERTLLHTSNKSVVYVYTPASSTTSTPPSSSGGGGYSGSGGGGHSSTGGPGVENTAHESSGGGDSSSGSSIGTDSLGGLPQTGEGNTAMILFGVCAVLAVLLAVLFYMRRKSPRENK